MAMGIVSEKEFEKELDNSNKPTIPVREIPNSSIEIIERGRGKDNVEVPNVLRNIIGETNTAEGRKAALQIAESFNLSPSSVSAYGKGATSTATYYDRPNKPSLDKVRQRIADKAKLVTESALDKLTDDKLEDAKPVELSIIAKNVSSIVKVMEGEINSNDNPLNISPIVIYAPQVKNEQNFDVVFAKE